MRPDAGRTRDEVLADTAHKANGLPAWVNTFLDMVRRWVEQAAALMKLGEAVNSERDIAALTEAEHGETVRQEQAAEDAYKERVDEDVSAALERARSKKIWQSESRLGGRRVTRRGRLTSADFSFSSCRPLPSSFSVPQRWRVWTVARAYRVVGL